MKKMQSLEKLFKGRHFRRDIIVVCVRRCLRYKLSYRDWVGWRLTTQRFMPAFKKGWNYYARITEMAKSNGKSQLIGGGRG